MTTWTQDNTEGDTDEQFGTPNEAQKILIEAFPEVEPQALGDTLQNVWYEDAWRDELVDAVSRRLLAMGYSRLLGESCFHQQGRGEESAYRPPHISAVASPVLSLDGNEG